MLSIKHTLASSHDFKPTITIGEVKKLVGNKPQEITLYYNDYNCSITYKSSRGGKTYYAQNKLPKHMPMPRVGLPVYYNVSLLKKSESVLNDLKLDLQAIRDWASERGLYEKGDPKTQTIKLQEEVGELASAILKNNKSEIIDSLGDIVVVLTNLAHLCDLKLEECIKLAYAVIKNRKGTMINGTFVKDGSKY